MSGETVLLVDQSGEVARLVRAIAGLEKEGLPRHALVGGIAVSARLEQRHRATTDIDEVYLGDEGDAVSILLEHGAERQQNGVILKSGEKLDLISVGDYSVEDLPDDGIQRAFILAHRWALDAATPLTLVVTDPPGVVLAEATTPVASVASLVAMKLPSALSRREGALHKRASDLFDVYRLLSVYDIDRSVATAMRDAPDHLATLIRDLADSLLVDEALRSVRWMISSGSPEMQDVTAEDVRSVGTAFRDHLDPSTA